jgi:hypothetical protein
VLAVLVLAVAGGAVADLSVPGLLMRGLAVLGRMLVVPFGQRGNVIGIGRLAA